jgi:hypothetical protein
VKLVFGLWRVQRRIGDKPALCYLSDMENPRLEQHIAQICGMGCTRVREIIGALERDHVIVESEYLSPSERAQVLSELKAIMAVYDAR